MFIGLGIFVIILVISVIVWLRAGAASSWPPQAGQQVLERDERRPSTSSVEKPMDRARGLGRAPYVRTIVPSLRATEYRRWASEGAPVVALRVLYARAPCF